MAEASGDLVNSIAQFHDPENVTPLADAADQRRHAAVPRPAQGRGLRRHPAFLLLDAASQVARLAERPVQHRPARFGNHTHFHLQHGAGEANKQGPTAPDNVDQRVQESIKAMTGGAIGLAMGVAGVVMSLLFVGQKLIEQSTYVSGLEFLGAYGSACLAFAAVAIYVPLNTLFAVKIGRALEKLTVRMQQAEGSYRGELTTFLRRSFHIAASRGEGVQRAMHDRLYTDIDVHLGAAQQAQRRLHVVRADLQFRGGADRRLRAEPAALHAEQDQPEILRHRRRAGELADQPVLVVHPRHAGDRVAQGQRQARDRSRRGDRAGAGAARFLQPHRPLGFLLRHPEPDLRPDRRASRC